MRLSTLALGVVVLSGCGAAAKGQRPAEPVSTTTTSAAAPASDEAPSGDPPPRTSAPEENPPPDPAGLSFSGGDGTSCDQAVVVHAPNEATGVPAEYDWLERHFPGYQRKQQALIQCGSRPADQLSITTADGQDLEVFFDIGEYFGKF
jgi:hypothetical protein